LIAPSLRQSAGAQSDGMCACPRHGAVPCDFRVASPSRRGGKARARYARRMC